MSPSPNWDGLPVGRHYQNGRHQNLWNYIFAYNSVSRRDRDKILVSKPMLVWMRNPMITLINPYDSWLTRNSNLKLAVFEINLNDINWSMGPMDPTCTRLERMKSILFCYWDPSQHERGMSPSPSLDGLPIWRHFQSGRQRSEITFSPKLSI